MLDVLIPLGFVGVGAYFLFRNEDKETKKTSTTTPLYKYSQPADNIYNISLPEPKTNNKDTNLLSSFVSSKPSKKKSSSKKDSSFVGATQPATELKPFDDFSTITPSTKKEIQTTVQESNKSLIYNFEMTPNVSKTQFPTTTGEFAKVGGAKIPVVSVPTKKEMDIKSFEVGKDTKIPEVKK